MRELVLEWNGRFWTLDTSRTYTLGRDPQGDVVLDDARVSWRHAGIRWSGRNWLIEDHGSTNGTYAEGRRIQQADLASGSTVRLGNADDGPLLKLSAAPAGGTAEAPATAVQAPVQAPVQAEAQAQAPRAYAPPAGPDPQQQHYISPQQHLPQVPAQQAPPHRGPGPGGAPQGYGDRSPTTFHQLALGRVMRIGRALENELVVSDLQVSRHHAEFTADPDGRFQLRDLGSHNGTYVNGQPMAKSGTVLIGPSDIVGIGHSTFRVVGDRLEEFVDTGEVSFSARHLTVTVDGGKEILKDVSFGVPEKSLVAVIGPSGSGKSTLLKALTGYRPANRGEVLYDQRSLYKQFAELRQRIGLVPQDDILHKELTVRKALRYAAKLRFPGDTAAAEREARIDEVLRELKLDLHRDKKITALSGGQRKRVSVALELLTKPSLIFLDEPTSGLDPGMDRDVMQLLRGLADDGRTVLVVTHSVAELGLCDKLLVMAPGGAVAYFGPPDEALNFFGYDTWADVFSAFENYRDYDWAGRWRGSQHYRLYAGEPDAAVPPQPAPAPDRQLRPPKPQSWGAQLFTLIRRYLSVIGSDKGFMGLMVILPAVLGLVSVVIPAKFGLAPAPTAGKFNPDAGTIILIIAVGMCFSGAANSVRELIKERVIYERERATGLSRSAYLMSKVIVLGMITALQGVIICAIGFARRALPDEGLLMPPAVEMCLMIIALGFTSMMFGLIISSLVRTAEKTMPLLVMFAIVQVVFTGVLFKVYGSPGLEQFTWLMPSRWAVAGVATTLDLGQVMPPWDQKNPGDTDPLWENTAAQWGINLTVLLAIGLICGFVVARLLRRHEPEVMRK
ncbi:MULTISPECIES: ABC transporter ATP-binding protein/permease [Streptomyces]|uniref:ABC transporter ATP-binding protein n=1 Tax=Streptomyces tsukubensis (strain DSM 42081 / NBRC 108919 / NRRL 18488 / 9993) TaxID=1114943 RepID=I2MW37_STRT9|nr:FHA domain-containing protein [Streptomyces tsukubensis]MYS66261.1 FHA domain-containing protein [Streptomyces sp. SID5473]AZK93428.1 ABC transporter ATP-binding protein [Streptomyces tsukubensis]EIF88984.1 ABC transporter ATP-binding protein [Streptomyces tsukubensis NRRL18488]QKM70417.1 ABC transporter ATP-binding protein [Streptomyces tsukubensis NRRL18488]TAI45596.1 FHA domain-containing protein [Streptomyces tsukubensis]